MKFIMGRHSRNTLLAIIIVLLAFLIVSDVIIYQHHKNTLYAEFIESKQEELRLIVIASSNAIANQNHEEIGHLLDEWGHEVGCIVEIKVTGKDGNILALYDRGTPAVESLSFESKGKPDDVRFFLKADTLKVMDDMRELRIEILIISIFIALMIACTIFIVTRQLSIVPLRRQLTKRKMLLRKIRRISKENRRLVESAGEGIFSLRNDGTCTFINDSALAMLGFKRSEIIDKDIHNLIHHTDPDGNNCAKADCQIIFTLKTAKGVIVDDDIFWRNDDTNFPVSYSSFPLEEGNNHIGVVVVFRDITEQHKKRTILEHQATHDALTSLVNRREFERRLDRAVATAKTEHKEHVLLYMDLDNFKQVNDTAGHNAGDELLRRVARKLSFLMRDRDTLARFGGDEFAVLLENCSLTAAMRIAGDITDAICGVEFTWDGMTFVIGVSIGLVEIDSSCSHPDAIIDAADGACYMAKQLGGCMIQVWSPELLMGDKVH